MQKIKEYWVYKHILPSGQYYIGYSGQKTNRRWKPYNYKGLSLEKFIDLYGWDNIEHIVIKDNLSKYEAIKLEGELIVKGWNENLCINDRYSGYVTEDMIIYRKEYLKNNKEHLSEKSHQWYINNKEYKLNYSREHYEKNKEYLSHLHNEWHQINKEYEREHKKVYYQNRKKDKGYLIYDRVNSYNRRHKDKVVVTALEAREMYELTGWIPNFVKNDDLMEGMK